MVEQLAKRKRDEVLAAMPDATASLPAYTLDTSRVIKDDAEKITFEGLYMSEGIRGTAVGYAPPLPVNLLVTKIVTAQSPTGPPVECTEEPKNPVPAYQWRDDGCLALNVLTETVKTGAVYTTYHHKLAQPYVLKVGTLLKVKVPDKAIPGGSFPKAPLVPVTLHNCVAGLYDPTKVKAKDTTGDAAAQPAGPAASEDGDGGGSKRPSITWKAGAVTLDSPALKGLALEHLVPRMLPFEQNLFPRWLAASPDEYARPLAKVGNMGPEGLPVAPRVVRLCVNRNIRGMPAESALPDMSVVPYVLPDEALSLIPGTMCTAATRTMIRAQADGLARSYNNKSVGLRGLLFGLAEQWEGFKIASDEVLPVSCTRFAFQDVQIWADSYLPLGISCWPLADRVLLPGSGLPPVPYYLFAEYRLSDLRTPKNLENEGAQVREFVLPKDSMRFGPIIPRMAEYITRFWMPVTDELALARYVDVDLEDKFAPLYVPDWQKALVKPPDSKAAKFLPPIDWERYTYLYVRHPGFIPLDGNQRGIIQRDKRTGKLRAPGPSFRFYALPLFDVSGYPIQPDEITLPTGNKETFRKCGIADEEQGTAFVIKSLRDATRNEPELAKLSDEELIITAEAWLQPPIKEYNNLRIPRWTFALVPRSYVPVDPATYPQPSVGAVAEPGRKKQRVSEAREKPEEADGGEENDAPDDEDEPVRVKEEEEDPMDQDDM